MAKLTTTNGQTSVQTTLADSEAATICGRIPMNHKDREFAGSMVRAFNNSRMSQNQRVWLHVMAYAQLRREREAAAVVAATPAVVPAVVAPVSTPVIAVPTIPVARAQPEAPNHPAFPTMNETEVSHVATGLRLTMLMYDIPERSNVTNPSGRLRRIGMRINKSVWIVPTESVPQYLVNELITAGAAVITAPYDVEASKNLLVAAVAFANRELSEAVSRAEASRQDAEDEFNRNGKRGIYDRKIAAISKRLKALAEEMEAGAKVFGVVGGMNFQNIRQAATAISNTTAVRAAVYANAANTLRTINTPDAVAMAVAAENDQAATYAMSDMIRESGNEQEADEINAAFDDGTFSLVDASDEE
jgi:hypothetical protein